MNNQSDMIALNFIVAKRHCRLGDFQFTKRDEGGYFRFYQDTDFDRFVFHLETSGHFPDEPPRLLLISPRPLPTHDGTGTLDDGRCSHMFHINGADSEGVNICYAAERWTPNTCITQIIIKAFIWTECYLRYLKDGRTINTHIQEMFKLVENPNDADPVIHSRSAAWRRPLSWWRKLLFTCFFKKGASHG